jgi:hypothetical protein
MELMSTRVTKATNQERDHGALVCDRTPAGCIDNIELSRIGS